MYNLFPSDTIPVGLSNKALLNTELLVYPPAIAVDGPDKVVTTAVAITIFRITLLVLSATNRLVPSVTRYIGSLKDAAVPRI